MLKKIQSALLLSCLSASSYAYLIQGTLTVENKTDIPMAITVKNDTSGQVRYTKQLPPHEISHLQMDNGDGSGFLYQKYIDSFIIGSEDSSKTFVKGNILYYVGSAVWNKYNYLQNVSTTDDGIKVDTHYSCKNYGYSGTIENKIVIEGVEDTQCYI